MIDWSIDRLIDWFIDSLIDWLDDYPSPNVVCQGESESSAEEGVEICPNVGTKDKAWLPHRGACTDLKENLRHGRLRSGWESLRLQGWPVDSDVFKPLQGEFSNRVMQEMAGNMTHACSLGAQVMATFLSMPPQQLSSNPSEGVKNMSLLEH